jgi:hypothetical protein
MVWLMLRQLIFSSSRLIQLDWIDQQQGSYPMPGIIGYATDGSVLRLTFEVEYKSLMYLLYKPSEAE